VSSLSGSQRGTAYWLTPVKAHADKAPEKVVRDLVINRHVYAFHRQTQVRNSVKSGDWMCFYASGLGVVAHARVASEIENKVHRGVPREYSWTFRLEEVHAYIDDPMVLDFAVRQELDAFRGRDLTKHWAWFVLTTRKITDNDFNLLTHTKKTNDGSTMTICN